MRALQRVEAAVVPVHLHGHVAAEALQLLLEMLNISLTPDMASYSAAISACEKGNQWKESLELL